MDWGKGASIEDRIMSHLNDEDGVVASTDQLEYMEDDELLEKMYDLITTLDADKLSEWQAEQLVDIIDDLAGDDEPVDEVKRVRISPAEKRNRARSYKKNKQKIKVRAKRYRKTAGYKKYKKKSKRMSKSGKTSTGKLVRKFI